MTMTIRQKGTMSLPQKGKLQSVPRLADTFEGVSLRIQAWPGIVAATHWHLYHRSQVDGADFYVGDAELGHIHLDGEVHLATTPELRAPLVAAGLARPFTYGGSYSGWVEASIKSPADARRAVFLFRLNYDRLQGMPIAALLDRIAAERNSPEQTADAGFANP